MGLDGFSDRMQSARVEAAAYATEIQRRAEESFAHIFALGCVVLYPSVVVNIAHRLKALFLVDEFG